MLNYESSHQQQQSFQFLSYLCFYSLNGFIHFRNIPALFYYSALYVYVVSNRAGLCVNPLIKEECKTAVTFIVSTRTPAPAGQPGLTSHPAAGAGAAFHLTTAPITSS